MLCIHMLHINISARTIASILCRDYYEAPQPVAIAIDYHEPSQTAAIATDCREPPPTAATAADCLCALDSTRTAEAISC